MKRTAARPLWILGGLLLGVLVVVYGWGLVGTLVDSPASSSRGSVAAPWTTNEPLASQSTAAPKRDSDRTLLGVGPPPAPGGKPPPLDQDKIYQAALWTVRGRIVDRQRQPLSGVSVNLFPLAADLIPGSDPSLRPRPTTSGADGVFEVRNVYPSWLVIQASDGSSLSAVYEPFSDSTCDSNAPLARSVDLGDVVVEPGGAVQGRVVGPAGQPVSGAEIVLKAFGDEVPSSQRRSRAHPGENNWPDLFLYDPEADARGGGIVGQPPSFGGLGNSPRHVARLHRTQSNDAGSFELRAVPPGLVFVTVRSAFPAVARSGTAVAGQTVDLGKIRLAAGHTSRGRVVDPAGIGIAGAELRVGCPWPGQSNVETFVAAGSTAADGRFRIDGIPGRRVTLLARRGPGHVWVQLTNRPTEKEHTLRLPGTFDVDVTVVGGGGRTGSGVQFALAVADETQAEWMGNHGNQPSLFLGDRLVDLGGWRYRLRDLDEGSYWLAAHAGTDGRAVATIDGDTRSLTLELDPRNQSLLCKVVDGAGRPVSNAFVSLDLETMKITEPTNARGLALFEPFAAGRGTLYVRHPAFDFKIQEVPSLTGTVTVILTRPTLLEGRLRLTEGATDFSDWMFDFEALDGHEDEGYPPFFQSVVRADGSFEVLRLSPGRYELVAIMPPAGDTSFRLEGRAEPVFRLRGGQTTHIDVRVDWQRPRSVVLDGLLLLDGTPTRNLSIEWWTSEDLPRRQTRPDAQGRFRIETQAGEIFTLRVCSSDGDPRDVLFESPSHDLLDGGHDKLRIELRSGTITGVLLDAAEKPVPSCRIVAEGTVELGGKLTRSDVMLHAQSDERGRFRFERAPAGLYKVHAVRDGLRATATQVRLQPGQVRKDLRLRFRPPVAARGTIDATALGIHPPFHGRVHFGSGPVYRSGAVYPDGGFEVVNLFAGSYAVCISLAASGGSDSLEIEYRDPVQIGTTDRNDLQLTIDRADGDALLEAANKRRRERDKEPCSTLEELLKDHGFRRAR